MNVQEMIDTCKKHTMYTWAAGDAVAPMPVERCEGIFIYEPSGKRYYDFNSQLMSVNIGHQHPKVIARMKSQLDKLLYCFPATATEIRAKLGKRLAGLVPGDINTFFFTLGGAEANENAIKAVRLYTGRHKIRPLSLLSWRNQRNVQLTGDPRRWPMNPAHPDLLKSWIQTLSLFVWRNKIEIVSNNFVFEEVIMYEGPDKIAAMFIETVTGTNGVHRHQRVVAGLRN